jgi:hypothetical protein
VVLSCPLRTDSLDALLLIVVCELRNSSPEEHLRRCNNSIRSRPRFPLRVGRFGAGAGYDDRQLSCVQIRDDI